VDNLVTSLLLPGPALRHPAIDQHARRGFALDRYFLGPENRLLAAALSERMDPAADSPLDPIFLHGPPQVGKSHLSRGLGLIFSQDQESPKAVITTGRSFHKSVSAAHCRRQLGKLRAHLTAAAALIIDDVDQLLGHPQALRELQIAVDHLENGRPLLLTSRQPPHSLRRLPAALSGRLASGLSIAIAQPAWATRCKIIEALARERKWSLSAAAIRMLAEPDGKSVAQLTDVCEQLTRRHRPVTESDVRRLWSQEDPPRSPTVAEIVRVTSAEFSLPAAEITGTSRSRTTASARRMAMFLARQLTDLSLIAIGRHFGGRDHTTVLYSCRRVQQQLSDDPETRTQLERLTSRLRCGRR